MISSIQTVLNRIIKINGTVWYRSDRIVMGSVPFPYFDGGLLFGICSCKCWGSFSVSYWLFWYPCCRWSIFEAYRTSWSQWFLFSWCGRERGLRWWICLVSWDSGLRFWDGWISFSRSSSWSPFSSPTSWSRLPGLSIWHTLNSSLSLSRASPRHRVFSSPSLSFAYSSF